MKELTEAEIEPIRALLPIQRGNVRVSNLNVINAVLHVAEQGCEWRALSRRFGPWHTVYMRMRRWAAAGVLDRVFQALQEHGLFQVELECASLDSTSIEVHLDGTGARKETDRRRSASPAAVGTPKFIGLPRMVERP